MAKNNSTPGNTGGGALAGAGAAAANLAGPALDLAQGATAVQAASNALKGAVLDKLLGPTALFAGGLIGVLRTVKSIVEQSGILERGLKNIASLQQVEGKFEVLLKSADAANKRIRDLYKFTADSPFKFGDVAEANRILETLTKGALSGGRGMQMVGDVAAATGQSMSETAERVGKLYNALRSGRSLDKVLFQMQMTGMATDDMAAKLELAQAAGQSFEASWAMVESALKTSSGGMKAQASDLETLRTKAELAGQEMETAFGQPFVEAQTAAIKATIAATKNLTPVLQQMGSDLAPFLTFFGTVKSQISVATIATKGFGDALLVAWTGFKAVIAAVATGTFLSMASNIGAASSGVLGFVASLKAAAAAQTLMGPSTSLFLAAQASEKLAQGSLLAAAGLKAQALWSTVSTGAIALHRAAMDMATASTAGFSISTYLAATATGVLGAAAGLAKKAILGMAGAAGRAFVALFVTNPILGFIALLAGVATALVSMALKTNKVHREYIDWLGTLTKVNQKLGEQVKAVTTLDDWRDALAAVNKEMASTIEQIKNLKPDDELFDDKLAALRVQGLSLQAKKSALGRTNMATVGLSQQEVAAVLDRSKDRASLRDATEQARFDRSDEYGRRDILQARRSRLTNEIIVGKSNREGTLSPERFKDNPTELMRVSGRILALQKAKKVVPESLIAQQGELKRLADSVGDNEQRRVQTDTELKQLNEQIDLKETELILDAQIAQTKARGGEVAGMLASKELTLLKEQLRIAKEKGALGELEARAAQQRIDDLEGNRAKARAEIAIDRAKNNEQINRNPRAAQALQDVADREKLRAEYEAKGLTTADADSDFAASIKAQAAQTAPRIVADSLQSIGGGGGSAGSDPMLAAQVRIEKINTTQAEYLRIIANAATGGDSTLRD